MMPVSPEAAMDQIDPKADGLQSEVKDMLKNLKLEN